MNRDADVIDGEERGELVELIRANSAPLSPMPTGEAPRGTLPRPPRAVLCDLYGTLFISGSGDIGTAAADAGRAAAVCQTLVAGGLHPDGNLAAFTGDPLRPIIERHHAARRTAGVAWPEVDIVAVWDELLRSWSVAVPVGGRQRLLRRLAVLHECRQNPVWPMPGMAATLARLHQSGVPLGIVSNAQFYTELLFDALLEQPLEQLGFERALCAWSYRGLEAKPSSAMFRQVAATLEQAHGIPPGDILYLGNDLRNDIAPAAQAGMMTALFAGDQRSLRWRHEAPECRHVRPDVVITDLTAIAIRR